MSITRGLLWIVVLALLLSVTTASSQTNPRSDPRDERPPTVVVTVSDDGFHWVDAGLGAAAALAATLLAFGLVLALQSNHEVSGNQ